MHVQSNGGQTQFNRNCFSGAQFVGLRGSTYKIDFYTLNK